MTMEIILWVYILLLVAGGLVGYFKAGSKPSLFASLIFAVLLSLCAMGIITYSYMPDILLIILLFFFGWRFTKGKKFIPGGLMSLLTVLTLALRYLL